MGVFSEHLTACAKIGAQPVVFAAARLQRNDLPGYKQKKARREELRESIGILLEETQQKCDECEAKIRELGQRRTALCEEKGRLYSDQDASKAQLSDLEAKCCGIQVGLNRLLEEIEKSHKVVDELRRKQWAAHEKQQELAKWGWVPGYGLYLLIDYFTDEDVKHLDSISQNLCRMEQDVKYSKEQLQTYFHQMADSQEKQSTLGKKIIDLENRITDTITQLNNTNRDLVQWMELQLFYSGLRAQLDSEACDPDEIGQKLRNLRTDLAKIA